MASGDKVLFGSHLASAIGICLLVLVLFEPVMTWSMECLHKTA